MDADPLFEKLGACVARNDAAIAAASCGPLTVPAGLHTRTRRPERDGVLCQRVFGPIVDLRCLCTKLRGEAARGQRCPRCGVTVLPASARSGRFGHVELVAPLRHPWLSGVQVQQVPMLPPPLRLPPRERGDPDRDPDAHALAIIAVDERDMDGSTPVSYPDMPSLTGLSALYADLVARNEALRAMLRHAPPELIVEHATERLQAALDALFGPPTTSHNPRGRRLRDLLLAALDRGDDHEVAMLRLAAGLDPRGD
jgi:hypothetical protein